MRNIITEVFDNVTPKLISNTARTLGESESGISKSLSSLVPTILFRLSHHLDGSKGKDFFKTLKNEKNTSFLNHLDGLLEKDNFIQSDPREIANGFMKKLFGNQLDSIQHFIGQEHRLKSNSSKGMMTIACTLLIGYLGKEIRKSGMNFNAIKSFLGGQSKNIEAALPLGVFGLLEESSSATIVSTNSAKSNKRKAKTAAVATYASDGSTGIAEAVSTGSSFSWGRAILGLLFLLGAFGIGNYFLNNFSSENKTASTSAKTEQPQPTKKEVTTPALPESDINNESENSSEIASTNTTNESADAVSKRITEDLRKDGFFKNKKSQNEASSQVQISKPVRIDEPIVVQSSPGIDNTVSTVTTYPTTNNNTNNTSESGIMRFQSLGNNSEILSSKGGSAEKIETKKVQYEDYIKTVEVPTTTSSSSGEENNSSETMVSKNNLPVWYLESKEKIDGNTGDVKISVVQKTETISESRNTSRLLELQKTLPLTVYRSWFGGISNPISSTEYRLYSYLEGKIEGKTVDKFSWFNLDKVKFTPGTARLEDASNKDQLGRIASMLKAYPKVKLKLGGFTSNVGKRKDNRKISMEMAENVKQALVSLGIDESRLSVKGYGETRPAALNYTKEGRAKNHRVGFRVMSK